MFIKYKIACAIQWPYEDPEDPQTVLGTFFTSLKQFSLGTFLQLCCGTCTKQINKHKTKQDTNLAARFLWNLTALLLRNLATALSRNSATALPGNNYVMALLLGHLLAVMLGNLQHIYYRFTNNNCKHYLVAILLGNLAT